MTSRTLTTRGWIWAAAALAAGAHLWMDPVPVLHAQGTATGEQTFKLYCSGCHTIGRGTLVGPDLAGVTTKQPRAWLERWILEPDKMLAEQDPTATALLREYHNVPMPNLQLKPSDVSAILAYLEASASVAPAAAAVPAPAPGPALPGVLEAGKNLFTGLSRMQNGGPPCMACHSVAGIGALGGGKLGPDLTTVAARYGGAVGLNAFLTSTPTAVMRSVWSGVPLTDQERADLVAFLNQAPVTQRPVSVIWQLTGLAAVGCLVLLALAGLTWRGRIRDGVRRPMIATTRRTHGQPARD